MAKSLGGVGFNWEDLGCLFNNDLLKKASNGNIGEERWVAGVEVENPGVVRGKKGDGTRKTTKRFGGIHAMQNI